MSGTPQKKTPLTRQNALTPEQIQAEKQKPNPYEQYLIQHNAKYSPQKKLERSNSYTVEQGQPIRRNFGQPKQQGKGRSRKLKRKSKKTRKMKH